MVRARAASQMAVSIPFGAAHRVNFDTPPLKGLRLEPFRFHLGSRGEIKTCVRSANFAVPSGTVAMGSN
jgi:hypothetical protein